MLHEACVPHVRTMVLLPVILLLLLQSSFGKTDRTVLPQYTLEKWIDCSIAPAKNTHAYSFIACAAKMIETDHYGFRHSADEGICHLFFQAERNEPRHLCWKVVSPTG